MVTRNVHYEWRLREVMASRGLYNTTDLSPLLLQRGIERSQAQVWRLVTGTPERLSLPLLAALCDILAVTPAELIVTSATNAGGGGPSVVIDHTGRALDFSGWPAGAVRASAPSH